MSGYDDIKHTPIHRPRIENHGFFAFHDIACPVCMENHAVYSCQTGRAIPCWTCQDSGWATVRLSRFAKWVRWIWMARD